MDLMVRWKVFLLKALKWGFFFLHHLILGCTLAGAGVHLQFWLTATKSIEFAHVLH